ncbi:MAG: hypothetical protein M3Q81_01995 [bacterium]|nr:hypothetical protein [bacterium]
MSVLYNTLIILSSIVAAFIWVSTPALQPYSLQVLALAMILYLVLKKFSRSGWWHLAPGFMSLDMACLTFSTLLLIGATGNTNSPFFAVGYIHLFLLIFTARVRTALLATGGVILFHYTINPELTMANAGQLLSLPVMSFFFLFAKDQYLKAYHQRQIIEAENNFLSACQLDQRKLYEILAYFIKPKLQQLQQLMAFPQQNQQLVLSQLTLLQLEVEKTLAKIVDDATKEDDTPKE